MSVVCVCGEVGVVPLMELGRKGARGFGKLATLVRGMFVSRRQCDLAPGDIVEDN